MHTTAAGTNRAWPPLNLSRRYRERRLARSTATLILRLSRMCVGVWRAVTRSTLTKNRHSRYNDTIKLHKEQRVNIRARVAQTRYVTRTSEADCRFVTFYFQLINILYAIIYNEKRKKKKKRNSSAGLYRDRPRNFTFTRYYKRILKLPAVPSLCNKTPRRILQSDVFSLRRIFLVQAGKQDNGCRKVHGAKAHPLTHGAPPSSSACSLCMEPLSVAATESAIINTRRCTRQNYRRVVRLFFPSSFLSFLLEAHARCSLRPRA